MKLAPAFERLLEGWKAQGYELVALRDLRAGLDPAALPLHTLDGVTEANVAEAVLERTREAREHVFTLHAELEGMKLAPAFERLLEGWKAQGYELVALRDLRASLDPAALPLHAVRDGEIPRRSGTLALQGPAFLAFPINAIACVFQGTSPP